MPTYDYICRNCDAAIEIFQSITASPKRKCPECGALKLERQIGAGAGIIFKGSGFYTTDYRSESYKAGEKKDRPPSSKSDTDSAPSSGSSVSSGKAGSPAKDGD